MKPSNDKERGKVLADSRTWRQEESILLHILAATRGQCCLVKHLTGSRAYKDKKTTFYSRRMFSWAWVDPQHIDLQIFLLIWYFCNTKYS